MDWTAWFGSPGQTLASAFVVATYSTKTMVPLRIFGILTNLILIVSSISQPSVRNHAAAHGAAAAEFLSPLPDAEAHQGGEILADTKTSTWTGSSRS